MNNNIPFSEYPAQQAQIAISPFMNSMASTIPGNFLHFNVYLRHLFEENQNLRTEVENLQTALEKSQSTRGPQRPLSEAIGEEREPEYRPYSDKPRKVFLKDKKCPIEGCERRYSSKIAVNSHIRKHHIGIKRDS